MAEADVFFEEVYLPTTRGLLTPRMTRAEVEVIARQVEPRSGDRLLDLGCGHGRHATLLAEAGYRVVGLDRARAAVRAAAEEAPTGLWVRGDYHALPFADGTFSGAYAWYSGLFLSGDDRHPALLREIRRVLEPGGRLLHDAANPERLASQPLARHQARLPDGGRVEEVCRFDVGSGREHGWRRRTLPDGGAVEARWSVRHYRPEGLVRLLEGAGFAVECLTDERGRPFDRRASLDLVVVARRPERARQEDSKA